MDKQLRRNIGHEPHSGRPPTAVTHNKIELRRSKNYVSAVRESVGIGSAAINTILNDHLKYRKLVSRWVTHSLTEGQKLGRIK
ncbi:hypothetical protein LAZ67_16000370 [Cordylochernes scorpioides]|uniref:Uncharacterized protein n=1 Tax=Cordylochernes scorpioides TaxID=51811 RepID=A0ABY6LAJ3_9ARAC|nr:hypothetical protein LAZ67_16000370 [Cordylochernes scorpioides]